MCDGKMFWKVETIFLKISYEKKGFERLKKKFWGKKGLHHWWVLDEDSTVLCSALLCYRVLCSHHPTPSLSSPYTVYDEKKVPKGLRIIFEKRFDPLMSTWWGLLYSTVLCCILLFLLSSSLLSPILSVYFTWKKVLKGWKNIFEKSFH